MPVAYSSASVLTPLTVPLSIKPRHLVALLVANRTYRSRPTARYRRTTWDHGSSLRPSGRPDPGDREDEGGYGGSAQGEGAVATHVHDGSRDDSTSSGGYAHADLPIALESWALPAGDAVGEQGASGDQGEVPSHPQQQHRYGQDSWGAC